MSIWTLENLRKREHITISDTRMLAEASDHFQWRKRGLEQSGACREGRLKPEEYVSGSRRKSLKMIWLKPSSALASLPVVSA